MNMNKNLAEAVQFTREIKRNKNILQVILFGSVARGEEGSQSDIDIAIVHDSEDQFSLMQEVNKNKPQKIQTTFVHIKNLPNETELVGALNGDGLLLYGKPIRIQSNKLDLTAKVLIAYALNTLSPTDRVKVSRALYGSVSKSSTKGKVYMTKTKGLAAEIGVEKINKGVLLVDRKKAPKIVNMLKRFGAKVQEIPVWSY
ncbi:MAG TPA: nucleotidyltransferase domain-containing protein [Candidatus Nanoarchaeia archaeon]|nr:nucleotidyltransferase domain-containing protein [Candidatus Nanoarchaeia archaeon]